MHRVQSAVSLNGLADAISDDDESAMFKMDDQ